mmetsp:Transcript_21039/g.61383  ORF Transcript_21039/g.61383 Transcript_21039/m.61383 type:complete len:310 (-) Transcript_21039:201-1130(-)
MRASRALWAGMRVDKVKGLMSHLYLAIYDDGRRLLLDSGCRGDFSVVQSHLLECTREGPGAGSGGLLSACVVTHAHPDHSGAAEPWVQAQVPVVAPRGVNLWYKGLRGGLQRRIDIGLARLVIHLTATGSQPSFLSAVRAALWEVCSPSGDLALPGDIPYDLEVVEEGPVHPLFPDWVALQTPGHTSHMLALYHAEAQVLYAADCLIYIGGQFRLPLVVDFPSVQAETLRRLASLPLKQLLLAHGGAFSADRHNLNSELLRLAEEAERIESDGPPGDLRWRIMRPFTYVVTEEILRSRRVLRSGGSVLP